MAKFDEVTHIFKVADGLSLAIDVLKPPSTDETAPVLLHFHGGFLVTGQKTTLPPHWLINACHNRGWVYATAAYRLLPEAKALDILQDAVDAVCYVYKNISTQVIIAGSSAGGYLALAAAAYLDTPRPVAVLSIYGMLDPASDRYTRPGKPLLGPVENEAQALAEINAALQSTDVIDGCPFPSSPLTDQRFKWIRVLHQAAQYADVLTRRIGLAQQIAANGVQSVPQQDRPLFPASFGLSSTFPPTVLLHGDADELVEFEQSAAVAATLRSFGVDVSLERAEGQGHGFDAKEVVDLDANDEGLGGKAVRDTLRRVVTHLERYVVKS